MTDRDCQGLSALHSVFQWSNWRSVAVCYGERTGRSDFSPVKQSILRRVGVEREWKKHMEFVVN